MMAPHVMPLAFLLFFRQKVNWHTSFLLNESLAEVIDFCYYAFAEINQATCQDFFLLEYSLQARRKMHYQNVPWAISKKICDIRRTAQVSTQYLRHHFGYVWWSPFRFRSTDWLKSWYMTYWTRPYCTFKEPSTICNRLSKRLPGHENRFTDICMRVTMSVREKRTGTVESISYETRERRASSSASAKY
jgi:hypothetical protein